MEFSTAKTVKSREIKQSGADRYLLKRTEMLLLENIQLQIFFEISEHLLEPIYCNIYINYILYIFIERFLVCTPYSFR